MKDKQRLTIIQILITLAFSSGVFAGEFHVLKVYDGDSFRAVGHDVMIEVRLAGIDAPERPRRGHGGQPFSEASGEFLSGLILNKVVDIQGCGKDCYNRILAMVFVNGRNVNLELLRAGMAETYKRKQSRDFDLKSFRHAEKKAREELRGMWSLGAGYVSPSVWRKANRQLSQPNF